MRRAQPPACRRLRARDMLTRAKKTLCCGSGGFADLISPALAGRWVEIEAKRGRRAQAGDVLRRLRQAFRLGRAHPGLPVRPEAALAGKDKIACRP